MSNRTAIQNVIQDVVSEVKASLELPVLTFMYGTITELISDLHSMSGTPESAREKYPLVWMPMDVTEKYTDNDFVYEVTLRLIICSATDSNYTTAERYIQNFTPTLQPIYEELLAQLALNSDLYVESDTQIPHSKTDRVHWGKTALISSDGQGIDFVDAIEIENLTLKVKFKNC